jgi:hypothetical protein
MAVRDHSDIYTVSDIVHRQVITFVRQIQDNQGYNDNRSNGYKDEKTTTTAQYRCTS